MKKTDNPLIIWKQKLKGISDSPCIDECDFRNKNRQCPNCGLLRNEKKEWKFYSNDEKAQVMELCEFRRLNLTL